MPPGYSGVQLPTCDFRFLDQCVQAIAKAFVATRRANSRGPYRRWEAVNDRWFFPVRRGTEVIYLDGWDGLGASSVLRALVKSMASNREMWKVILVGGLGLEPIIISMDFSRWESIRYAQRCVAEELNIPSWVMEKFDQQDEEDDFDGVDPSSRSAIAHAERAIRDIIKDRGFVLFIHNGRNEEIDVGNLSFSSDKCVKCTVLWTFRVGFRVDPKLIDKVLWKQSYTNHYYYYRCPSDDGDNIDLLLRAEAEEVAQRHGMDPAMVLECFTYMLDRSHMSLHNIEHDWALHACNYWICDGIMPQAPDTWQVGEALRRDMEFFIEYLSTSHKLSRQGCTQVDGRDLHLHHMRRSDEHRPYFISTETCGFILNNQAGIVPDNKFQHSDKIRVLKLSRCTFRFASPPFLCCHSLRFLCLDHCRNLVSSTYAEEEEDTTRSWPCFQNLWVLDLRYMHWDEIFSAHMLDLMTQLRELNVMGGQNWDMSHLHGRLSNIHKLRVTKSACCYSNSEEVGGHNLFFEMGKMEVFEFSENHTTQGMTILSGASRSLETVTVGACVGLENISFRGCQELKDLFFTGLFASLEELDLSNTAIKILDLGKLEATHLKRLILLGCEKLRAILWPLKAKTPQNLEVLHINTTKSASSCQANLEGKIKEDRPSIGSSSSACGKELVGSDQAASFDFNWCISMGDARLLRSIVPVEQYLKGRCVCIEMDSYPASNVVSGGIQGAHGIRNQTDHYLSCGKAASVEGHPQVVAVNEGVITLWACPPVPNLTANDCYFHIQDEEKMWRRYSWDQIMQKFMASPPALICNITNVLHVHNSLSITCFPSPPDVKWNWLEWCKVERCPKLSAVFYSDEKRIWDDNNIFRGLRTFWASQLPEATCIWSWSWSPTSMHPGDESFHCLEFLHLDCCPKLKQVLYISKYMDTLPCLETLEIVSCGDLVEVFPLIAEHPNRSAIMKLPRLKHIHLHELPMMQKFCGHMISTPALSRPSRLGAVGAFDVCRPSLATPSRQRWTARRNGGKTWNGTGCRQTTTLPSTS